MKKTGVKLETLEKNENKVKHMSTITKHLTPKRSLFIMILGSAIFMLYIYFSIGINEFIIVGQNLNFTSFLLFLSLGLVTMLLAQLSWAASWLTLLNALSINIGIRKTFLYYFAGDFVDRLVPSPGVVGDVTRAFLVRKEKLSTYGAVAAALITNRIVAYGVVMASLTAGITFLLLTNNIPMFATGLLIAVWLGALASFLLLSIVVIKENAVKKTVKALIKLLKFLKYKKAQQLSSKAFKFLSRFHEGFKFYAANRRYLILPIIFNTVSFALNFVVYISAFYALGLTHIPIAFLIVVYFLAGAIQDAAAVLSVGGLEIFLMNIFILYGISPATSGVAAVLLRGLAFYFPLVMGYITMQIIGANKLLKQRTTEQTEEEEIQIWTELPQTPLLY